MESLENFLSEQKVTRTSSRKESTSNFLLNILL